MTPYPTGEYFCKALYLDFNLEIRPSDYHWVQIWAGEVKNATIVDLPKKNKNPNPKNKQKNPKPNKKMSPVSD